MEARPEDAAAGDIRESHELLYLRINIRVDGARNGEDGGWSVSWAS